MWTKKNKNSSSDSLRSRNLLVITDSFLAIVWDRMDYFEKNVEQLISTLWKCK